jgi:hypothetical protein
MMRRTPLRRTSMKRRPRKATVPANFWATRREELYARAGGRCEAGRCNLNDTGMDAHHRKLRSRGGKDDLENLLAVCPHHHRYIHDHPDRATRHGWMVSRVADPATVPVDLWDGRTVHLTPDGGYDALEHQEHMS